MTTLDKLAERIVSALMLELESREIPATIELKDGTLLPLDVPVKLEHTEQTKVLWESMVIGMIGAWLIETDDKLRREYYL